MRLQLLHHRRLFTRFLIDHHEPRSMSTSTSTKTRTRTYSEAISLLNSLQSNSSVIENLRKNPQQRKDGDVALDEMRQCLNLIGYNTNELNQLNVLHITGTKGKGSTSAFVDSILRTLEPRAKIGLYSSPHMVAVRERIRLNGKPLEEHMFAKYFFQVWDRLQQATDSGLMKVEKPAYFRYLTLMAFHVFLQEKVDATILEVGIGGTYDSTNIVPQPIVTGVTSLGIDHIHVLGKTLAEIAHQKGGIYKENVPALSVIQPQEGMQVLKSRADELNASSFIVIPEIEQLSSIKLGLAGAHQRINASLAVGLVQSFLSSSRVPTIFSSSCLLTPNSSASSSSSSSLLPNQLPESMIKGLEKAKWPGRCQIEFDPIKKDKLEWFLDGAHTIESLTCCGQWFAQASSITTSTLNSTLEKTLSSDEKSLKKTSKRKILVFNCTSGRSGFSLLQSLVSSIEQQQQRLQQRKEAEKVFDRIVFCTNTTFRTGSSKGDLTSNAVDQNDLDNLTIQNQLKQAWIELRGDDAQVHVLGSIEESVDLIRRFADDEPDEGRRVEVLVTGSLHLVGGVMAVANLPL